MPPASIQVPLQQRRLIFAKSLRDTPMLVKELLNYRTKTTQSTKDAIDIREGDMDDLVLVLALACWWGERRKREVMWWA